MPENVKGLPNVAGLENLKGLENIATTDKATTAPKIEAQPPKTEKPATTEPSKAGLDQFKTPEALLAAYKEVQGFSTRIAQENAEIKRKFAELQQRQELAQYQRPVAQPQQQPQGNFDSMFIANPQEAVAAVAAQTVQRQLQTIRIAEVLDEENGKNPQEYQERFAYANQLGNQYPQLTTSAAGVKKLFRMADEYRKTDYQKRGMEFVRAVIGEDVDMEKFRLAVRKDQTGQTTQTNNAYMPDTTSSNRTGPETGKTSSYDTEIADAVKRGDPDAVLNAQFRQLGLRK
jgi:hypothetical protein